MKDRVFIDTNIFVYAAIQDKVNPEKREKAVNLIQSSDKEIAIFALPIIVFLKNPILAHNIYVYGME